MNEIFQKNKEKIVWNAQKLVAFNVLCIFAQVTGLTFISALCIAIIVTFIGTAIFFKVRSFASGEDKETDVFKGEPVKREQFIKYYQTLYVELNNSIQAARKAAFFTDPVFTAKILGILFVTSQVAWHLGDFNFVWLAGTGYIASPLIRLFFGPQIRDILQKIEAPIQNALKKQKKD